MQNDIPTLYILEIDTSFVKSIKSQLFFAV
jgi:hypothetical protein